MKQLIFLLAFNASVQVCLAQEDVHCPQPADGHYSELPESAKPGYAHVLTQRAKNIRAAELALLYTPVSYVCAPYSEYGSPKAPYWLSADVHPNFEISSPFSRVSFHLTPRFIVRGLWDNPKEGDVSMPVRTPSYMPGGTLYIPLKIELHPAGDAAEHSWLSSIALFHHSNGQDGPTLDKTGKHLYHYDGNFSTFFIEPAVTYSRRSYYPGTECFNCPDPLDITIDFFARLGIEQHFWTADTMKSSYGSTRINLSGGWIKATSFCDEYVNHGARAGTSESYPREKWRLIFNVTFIAGHRDMELGSFDKRINAEVLYNHELLHTQYTGWFVAAGYYGSDPYNIYYDLSYPYIRAGLSLGNFNAPKQRAINKELIRP